MNRKLGQQDSSASSELMLDVLSNVFGGVILISCLLAILPRYKIPPPLTPALAAENEMVERRMQTAMSEIRKLKESKSMLMAETDREMADLIEARAKLRLDLQSMRELLADSDEKAEAEADMKAMIARGDEATLNKRLNEIQKKIASEKNLKDSIAGEIDLLKKRLENLGKQLVETEAGRPYLVRFPREREADADTLSAPLIVRYGRIYPLVTGNNYNPAIRRIPHPHHSDATIVKPMPEKGWKIPDDNVSLERLLRSVKGEKAYLAVYLYPDSHATFNALKSEMFKVDIDYGIDFVTHGKDLIFASEGSRPPKL